MDSKKRHPKARQGGKSRPAQSAQRETKTSRTAVADRPTERKRRPADIPAWEPKEAAEKPPRETVTNAAASFWRIAVSKAQRIRRRWRHIVREKRARNFPESERKPIQFLLFAWSMLPMLGSRLREAAVGRRKQRQRGGWPQQQSEKNRGKRISPVCNIFRHPGTLPINQVCYHYKRFCVLIEL